MSIGRPRKIEPEVVLQRAVELFWRYGYEATSMADLVKATGLHKGSLYQLYGSKKQLFIAALNLYIQDVYESVQRIERETTDPAMAYHEIMLMIINRLETNDCQGCMVSNTLNGNTLKDRDIQQILSSSMQTYIDRMAGILKRIPVETPLTLILPASEAAQLIMMLMIGMGEHLQINKDKQQIRTALALQLNCLIPGFDNYLYQQTMAADTAITG